MRSTKPRKKDAIEWSPQIQLIVKVICALVLIFTLSSFNKSHAETALNDDQRSELLTAVRSFLSSPDAKEIELQFESGTDTNMVVVALSNPTASAKVGRANSSDLKTALAEAAMQIREKLTGSELADGRIKVDIAVEIDKAAKFDRNGLASLDRNLQGLWLPEAKLLLTPEELTSRKLVTTRGDLQ